MNKFRAVTEIEMSTYAASAESASLAPAGVLDPDRVLPPLFGTPSAFAPTPGLFLDPRKAR